MSALLDTPTRSRASQDATVQRTAVWGLVPLMDASMKDRSTHAASTDQVGSGQTELPPSSFLLQTSSTALDIVLFLNKAKSRARQGKIFLVNASHAVEKGDPKNFIPDEGIQRIADTFIGGKEEEKPSRIVDHAELKKNDYNIFLSRYIHTSDAETYRPIAEIVGELDSIEAEAKETDKALRKILKQLGV